MSSSNEGIGFALRGGQDEALEAKAAAAEGARFTLLLYISCINRRMHAPVANTEWLGRAKRIDSTNTGALTSRVTRGYKDGLQPETLADGLPAVAVVLDMQQCDTDTSAFTSSRHPQA